MSIFSKPSDRLVSQHNNWECGMLGHPGLSLRYKFWNTLGMLAVLPFLILISWSEREHFRARAARGDKYCNK